MRWAAAWWLSLMAIATATAQDSLQVMTDDVFFQLVRQNHPVAKQGKLLVDQARAGLLSARGAFDPVLMYRTDQKTFDGKNYFNYQQSELVLPTWFGVEAYAGLENNFGDFINPELSRNRNSYAGVSVPLLRDLVLDKRRAALRQAQLFQSQSEWERLQLINDLLLDAWFSYWNWARDYQVFLVLENTVRINTFRYGLVKISFEQGDRAAIDTTEALAQLQSFQQQREEAWLKFRKSSLEVSTFLWLDNNKPVYLSELVIPDTAWSAQSQGMLRVDELSEWLTAAYQNHPKLQQLSYKLQIQEVERRLKFQYLLPKADLKYNFLQQGYDLWKGVNLNLFENNYKYGLKVIVPIPNRSGIGDYRSARIKIRSTELEQGFMQWTIDNKVRYHYNEVLNLQEQIRIFEDAYRNYVKLFEAEQFRFTLGETTLFLLNARENKALETLQKLLELKAKYYQAFASLNWASGMLR
ncbi:MAG TPA: TolC family protein [Lacibacter sp.]|nr:TolC family protein [Lacibacter sp.]